MRRLSFVYAHVCVWNGNQEECVYVCVNNYIMAGCLFTHCAANDELINKDFNYSPKQGALSHTHWNTTVADRRWHPVAPWFSAGTEMFIVPTIFCLNVSNHCKILIHTRRTQLNAHARMHQRASERSWQILWCNIWCDSILDGLLYNFWISKWTILSLDFHLGSVR